MKHILYTQDKRTPGKKGAAERRLETCEAWLLVSLSPSPVGRTRWVDSGGEAPCAVPAPQSDWRSG